MPTRHSPSCKSVSEGKALLQHLEDLARITGALGGAEALAELAAVLLDEHFTAADVLACARRLRACTDLAEAIRFRPLHQLVPADFVRARREMQADEARRQPQGDARYGAEWLAECARIDRARLIAEGRA